MDDLTYTLRALCRRNRDGSHATQADRLRTLTLAARQLMEAGFRHLRATLLKDKHLDVLLERWKAEGLSAGTLKNRIAHLRWWAEGRQGWLAARRQHGAGDPRAVREKPGTRLGGTCATADPGVKRRSEALSPDNTFGAVAPKLLANLRKRRALRE